jgi:hypothetical protein
MYTPLQARASKSKTASPYSQNIRYGRYLEIVFFPHTIKGFLQQPPISEFRDGDFAGWMLGNLNVVEKEPDPICCFMEPGTALFVLLSQIAVTYPFVVTLLSAACAKTGLV